MFSGNVISSFPPPPSVISTPLLSFRPKGEILVPSKERDLKDSSHTFAMTNQDDDVLAQVGIHPPLSFPPSPSVISTPFLSFRPKGEILVPSPSCLLRVNSGR